MKKKLVICLCLVLLMVTACGKTVVCDFCNEEKKGETKMVYGQEVNVCDDCLEEMQNLLK